MNATGATLLVAALSYFNGPSGDITVSSTSNVAGNWTALTAFGVSGTAGFSQLFYCVNPSTSASEIFTAHTSLGGGDYLSIAAFAFSGTLTTSGVYQAASVTGADSVTGTATTLHPGSGVTPSQTGALVITGFNFNFNNTTVTIDSGFSSPTQAAGGGSSTGVAGSYLIDANTNLINPTWTTPDADNLAATIAIFLPSGGVAAPIYMLATV
jgi:hypothetical protein